MRKYIAAGLLLCVFGTGYFITAGWTGTVLADEGRSATVPNSAPEVIVPGEPVEFPMRKPARDEIKKRWFRWQEYTEKLTASIRDLPPPDEALKQELLAFDPDFEASFAGVMQAPSKESFQYLGRLLKMCQGSQHPSLKQWGTSIKSIVQEYRQWARAFMNNTAIYTGLEAESPPDEMIANWLRYCHIFAYESDVLSPLFTKEYKRRIIFTPLDENPPAKDIFDELWNLFKMYYHISLKYTKDDGDAFSEAREVYGAEIQSEGDDTRFIKQDDYITPWAIVITWKLEKGAWRLHSFRQVPRE